MKGRKIFVGTDNMGQAAYFGRQNKRQALYGLREGYKTVQMTWLVLLSTVIAIQKC